VLTNSKELKPILKEAIRRGWDFHRGNNHIKGRHPSGKTATISVSPSDKRALKNIVRDLRIP